MPNQRMFAHLTASHTVEHADSRNDEKYKAAQDDLVYVFPFPTQVLRVNVNHLRVAASGHAGVVFRLWWLYDCVSIQMIEKIYDNRLHSCPSWRCKLSRSPDENPQDDGLKDQNRNKGGTTSADVTLKHIVTFIYSPQPQPFSTNSSFGQNCRHAKLDISSLCVEPKASNNPCSIAKTIFPLSR